MAYRIEVSKEVIYIKEATTGDPFPMVWARAEQLKRDTNYIVVVELAAKNKQERRLKDDKS